MDPQSPTVDRTVALLPPEPSGVLPATTLEALSRSELDVQVTTARRYPRSLAHFRAEALAMVRLDQATAASCYYQLPRRQRQDDGSWKTVTLPPGPSVRLAEIVASAWGNLRAGAWILNVTQDEVVARGFCHDLQTNYAIATEVYRSIVDRNGRRYSDDLVTLTKNAACAIARRNAVFAVVPRTFVNQLVDAAHGVAAGDLKSLAETRKRLLAEYVALGVSTAAVCAKLDRPGVEDLDLEDVRLLHGLLTALREGQTTVETEFPRDAETAPDAPSAAAALAETVRRRRAAREQELAAAPGRGAGEPPSMPSVETPATPPPAAPDEKPTP
jgi:hypothetical protein